VSEEKNCVSQYASPFNAVVANCELKGPHYVHRGDGYIWRPGDEKPRYTMPREEKRVSEPIPKTEIKEEEPSASERQVGGDHYGDELQPIDVIDAWGLDFYEGSALKYLARHRKKNGREDIEKAIHYLELLLERQY
jgi:hypothetical protein